MLKDFLQGMVVGLANIIPGVSGGTILVAMGSYKRLIHALTHLRSEYKSSLHFLIPLLAGILASVLLFCRMLEYCFIRFPIATDLAFCGLILGSLPVVVKPVLDKKPSASMLASFVAFFGLVIAMALFRQSDEHAVILTLDLFNVVRIFVIGIIAAATMVIPGISGSMILMLLGFYQPILGLINAASAALFSLDLPLLLHAAGLLVPLGLGLLAGIFLFAGLIEYALKHWHYQVLWAIVGLILASPVAILLQTSWAGFSFVTALFGIFTFCLGAWVASRLAS